MKTIHFETGNLKRAVVGKVTYRAPLFSAKGKICISNNLGWKAKRCAAVICLNKEVEATGSVLQYVTGLDNDIDDYLTDGDVIRIEPRGDIIKLYDSTSPHNSLFVTSRCNCRCVMCPQKLAEEDEVPTEELVDYQVRIVSMIDKKTESLGITGGEPTILGDGLVRLVDACKSYLPKTALAILSNGIAFKDLEFVKKLAMVGHPDLVIAIALYGDNDTSHDKIVGRKGAFFDTVKGLHNLALCRQKIEIRNVINSLTYQRLPQYSDFLYRNFPFAVHIALMGMELTETAKENAEQLWIDPDQMADKLSEAIVSLSRRKMNVSIYNLPLCVLPESVRGFSTKSISEWKNAYLPICQSCAKRSECGGYFTSAEKHLSPHLKPFLSE